MLMQPEEHSTKVIGASLWGRDLVIGSGGFVQSTIGNLQFARRWRNWSDLCQGHRFDLRFFRPFRAD
jgi:hypothetical protein